jgi:cytoskeleton protein RodZ
MTPVGETLRRERMKRNLDLEEISRELKISTRFLQAIENDQYEKLPGGVFAKSFVRQYARLLSLNEDDLAVQVQEILGPVVEVPQLAESRPSGVAPIHVPKVDEWETVGDKRFRWSGWLSAVVLVAVMLICSAVYAWIQRPKASVVAQANHPVHSQAAPSPVTAQPAPPPQTVASPPVVTAPPAATSPAVPAQTPEQKPLEPTAAAQKPPEPKPAEQKLPEQKPAAAPAPPPNPNATVHVEITADEAVWISARADGKYIFSATMDPHATRTIDGVKEVTLRLGNAGGVSISLNGKPIGSAGPKGQVRTIQFTSGGFQIVPAKPPSSVPLDPLDRL